MDSEVDGETWPQRPGRAYFAGGGSVVGHASRAVQAERSERRHWRVVGVCWHREERELLVRLKAQDVRSRFLLDVIRGNAWMVWIKMPIV